MIVIAICFLIY
ncbi:MAG: hypothetical protein PWQ39_1619, partial [Thermacetogenium sp.]|nr:hypothetical protein [Thermacetogenium sp.]